MSKMFLSIGLPILARAVLLAFILSVAIVAIGLLY